MENAVSQQPPANAAAIERGPWLLAVAGLLVFLFAWLLQGNERGLWLPGLGVGIALISWFGWRAVVIIAPLLLIARLISQAELGVQRALADTAVHVGLIASSWWIYHHVARGSRWLDDPRSVTIFLLIVPGGLSAFFGLVQAIYVNQSLDQLGVLAAEFWLSRMVGILAVTPLLIVAGTPLLLRFHLVSVELPPAYFGERETTPSRIGDRIELVVLTFATTTLALLLLWTRLPGNVVNWMMWACCLVLIVWTCIRQGMRGGVVAASVTSVAVLTATQMLEIPPEQRVAIQSGVQGHLLALCSSALLVGVSATWIRANEKRYRHVVSRIPFVVYSARLASPIPAAVPAALDGPKRDSKFDFHLGPSIGKLANVMLVSPACQIVLNAEPEALIGPFNDWLERIEPADRELVIASLAQLCLQKQPVTCEYRLLTPGQTPTADARPKQPAANVRWLRDTMTPHYSEEGLVDGWEGLVENITDQRTLSQNVRKMTNMLQVLLTNLPTGVFFVQAPQGYPILVNARARQLLGQREDLSAGLDQLSRVYRLHRTDGTPYPFEELPVCKALRTGSVCKANDIVVHRPDGRRIPLITWAAPIDLNNAGAPDGAVWVLEDWSTMQQAEQALRESELRLRAVIETMDEGLIVHDSGGGVIDCNPAACRILGLPREQLIRQGGLAPQGGCLQEDGSIFPREQQPDQRALRDQKPARGVILGLPPKDAGAIRWLLVNSLPLPIGPTISPNSRRARVVTTFADITEQVTARDSLRLTRDKYQGLVETLPFMLQQRDKDFNIIYVNPAAMQITGYSREELTEPGFCERVLLPEDLPIYQSAAQSVAQGDSAQIELRFRAKDGTVKSVLGFFHPNRLDGKIVGATCLIIDITMQRRLEAELQFARHLELVGRLASGTVHDFNNLLTVLMGMAGLAKTELSPDHAAWQYLSRIEEVGEQASHLTGQLLTFSKQRPRECKAVDINAIVTQTLKLAKSVLPAAIAVEAHLESNAPLALGDETAFKQILMNLCLNAGDAMQSGGTLTIRTDHAAPPTNHDGRAWVHLSIQDTGIGMPEHVRQRIFEPFFSTKERGTGLGLAVVQQIVKEFGGRIDVWSEQGVGTRFDIWLVRDAVD